ncbi:hypothetical protein M758_5G134900 [Ceratodon purpureus]|nr:hypothetical protein M758_5G134900 [Ceratodon purpureus]
MRGTEDEVRRGDDVVNVEEYANSHVVARRHIDFTNAPLQCNDHVCNSVVLDAIVLDNHVGLPSTIPTPLADTSELSPFDPTNPFPLSECHEMLESPLEGALAFMGEDSRSEKHPECCLLDCEADRTAGPSSNNYASGLNFNSNSLEVETSLLKVVHVFHQEKQQLMQMNMDLRSKLLELERKFQEHMLCCPERIRPSKKR